MSERRPDPLRFGAVELRVAQRQLLVDGKLVELGARAFDVLLALADKQGNVVTKKQLLAAAWPGVVVEDNNLQVQISALRKILGTEAIATVPGRGYQLTVARVESTGRPLAEDVRAPAAAQPSDSDALLAVLPFDNLSADQEMQFFSEGVSEEILHAVVRGSRVKVIGRGSSFQFRNADKATTRVAAALKATHILDGSVRRSGGRVRVSAHLVECAGATTVWSEQFDRELADVFSLQDEIAGAVVAALNATFEPTSSATAVDPVAYDLYLKAIPPSFQNPPSRMAAIMLLEQVTNLAPTFARGWAALATMRATRLRFDRSDQPYETQRAKVVEAAEKALQLDRGQGDAYQALSALEPFASYEKREALHKRAEAAAPNDSIVLRSLSHFCAEVGRFREALAYAERAAHLDPMSPSIANWHGVTLDGVGAIEESRAHWRAFAARWPNDLGTAIGAAGCRTDWILFDEMLSVAERRGLRARERQIITWFERALRKPEPDFITEALADAWRILAADGVPPFERIMGLCNVGKIDDAFALIDGASFSFMFDATRRWPTSLSGVAQFFSVTYNDKMIRDPRFVRLCNKLGLCDYWIATQRWPDCAAAVAYDFRAECAKILAESKA